MKMRTKRRSRKVQKTRVRSRYASKLTSKYQATVPQEIRRHLHLKKGDQILYELLQDDTVIIRKTYPIDMRYLQSLNTTLSEWETEEDEQAYKNL